jgi:hypothetical protein
MGVERNGKWHLAEATCTFTSHCYELSLHCVCGAGIARRQACIIFCSRNSHFLFPLCQQTNSLESPIGEHCLTLHTKHSVFVNIIMEQH